jgi:integrase
VAYIKKLTDRPRNKPWRGAIHRKGLRKQLVKFFRTRKEVERWAREQESSLDRTGLPLTIEDLKKVTVGDIVCRYLAEITPTKGCAVSEGTVLKKFLRRDICYKSLAFVSKLDAYKYINERLKETWRGKPITPRTIRREVNSIQRIFEVAKEQWGYVNLVNPFRGIEIRGSEYRRKRRLKDGELEKLEEACKLCRGLNQYYVPLAINLAIETGMRLQEIFNLNWQDIDFEKRRIEITKSKTDYMNEYEGRTIVLTVTAMFFLVQLCLVLHRAGKLDLDAKVFPITGDAFKQSWADVRKRAGIKGLTFHDLRREAGSRFDEAELSKPEHELMMGHKPSDSDMRGVYVHSHLKRIQDKLDRYSLHGKTYREIEELAKRNGRGKAEGSVADLGLEWWPSVPGLVKLLPMEPVSKVVQLYKSAVG